MLEILFCSVFTILPDYLYRRYGQGKRLGIEITQYSVWYELRYGLTACLMLAVALIAIIFYFHPSSSNVTAYFRTIPILPEVNGRVAEVYVGLSQDVKKGDRIFRLDDGKQRTALDVAVKRVAEVEAAMEMATAEIAAAQGQLQQAHSALQQAIDEVNTRLELQRRNAGVVATREIEKLQLTVEARRGGVKAAEASKLAVETKLNVLLPAEKATAEASRQQAEVELQKTVVYAGVDGRVEQFVIRVGDIVNPFMRPAGVLVPAGAGKAGLVAGFGQIEAQVMKPGMIAEVACISKPWTIIPMVVTRVQEQIASGQFRAGEQLRDAAQPVLPGTITVFMEPLYEGSLDGIAPGSSCVANAYSNHHDVIASKHTSVIRAVFLHLVDTVALVHAAILRAQTLMLPFKLLVFSGAH